MSTKKTRKRKQEHTESKLDNRKQWKQSWSKENNETITVTKNKKHLQSLKVQTITIRKIKRIRKHYNKKNNYNQKKKLTI